MIFLFLWHFIVRAGIHSLDLLKLFLTMITFFTTGFPLLFNLRGNPPLLSSMDESVSFADTVEKL